MKKYLIIILLFVSSFTLFAQRDISCFRKTTPEAIIQEYGSPFMYDSDQANYMSDYTLFYEHFHLFLSKSADNLALLDCFETDSSLFSVASQLISGGIHVGQSISSLMSIDFVHSSYGRNKSGNGLMSIDYPYMILDKAANYILFREEYEYIVISVEDGIVTAWSYCTKEDTPYPEYDYSVTLLQ